MTRSVLLIEDDHDIAELISLHLGDMDAEVTHAGDGVQGLSLALRQCWDLILLDLSLPRCDGLDICEQIKHYYPGTPIVVVTARGRETDRVRGLDTGADDYITKPFSVAELMARIKALFRRIDTLRNESSPSVLSSSGIVVDRTTRVVLVHGREVRLTVKEFELLLVFIAAPGRVFKRSELLEQVWGYRHSGYLHTVNTHINRLRGKIEPDPANPRYISTVWGVGYKLSLA